MRRPAYPMSRTPPALPITPRMTRLALLVAALLAAALSSAAPASASSGEIIVRFKADTGGSERAESRRAARVALKRSLRLSRTQVVQVEPGQDVGAAVAALRRDGRVAHAVPDFRVRKSAAGDPRFADLWGLHNTGQTVDAVAGTADADIDAPEAWDLFKSAPDTVVAVVDTGVRMDHPDLAGNLWTDVDDSHGWDFVDQDDDPTDLDSHGTHVAGTIAAQGDNAIGTSGVAWDAQIMAVRVLDENGAGDGQDIVDGLAYAAQKGARVVNLSLGGPGDASLGALYDDLFDDFPSTLFVVAAGNDGTDNDKDLVYPCNATVVNVVCVGATDSKDALAGFSNHGDTHVDLAAPGVSILSPVPRWSDPVGFSDDFSTGLDGWTNTGNAGNVWATFTANWYGGGTNAFLGEKPALGYSFANNEVMEIAPASAYDLTGRSACVLAWDMYYEFDEGKDFLQVRTSPDGVSWTKRQEYTGTSQYVLPHRLDLKADGSSVRTQFRTVANGTTGPLADYYGSLIDNVRVQCGVTPDASSYSFFEGTSMATPHVAGVATLLFGARPDASPAQVRSWLLATGDLKGALAGKTVTGRRLNAYNALLAAGVAELVTTGVADDVTPGGATLRGTINPGGTATDYRFEYGTAADALTSRTPTASAGSGSTATPVLAPVTGLAAETTYHYRLVAVQGGVETPGAVRTFKTSAVPVPVTHKPILTIGPATGVTTTAATVGGTIDPNGKPSTVVLEFGRASGSYTSGTSELAVDVPSDVGVELTGLIPGTTYFYRLRGHNADGESTSSEGSFTTLPGAAPGGRTNVPATEPEVQRPIGTVSVVCRRTRTRKVACKAGSTAAVAVSVRVFKRGRTYARGTAASLTKGRALRMRTVRRVRPGRYRLQITVKQGDKVVTTLVKTIRLR